MRILRTRRLILLMMIGAFALISRLSHAESQLEKASHILRLLQALNATTTLTSFNENLDSVKVEELASELATLQPVALARNRILELINSGLANFLDRYRDSEIATAPVVRAMNKSQLWTDRMVPFLVARIESNRVSGVAPSILLLGKKLERDFTAQKQLRDALTKNLNLENLAIIFEAKLNFRADYVMLIRAYEGQFLQHLRLLNPTDPKEISAALKGFPIGTEIQEPIETVALRHLVQRYKEGALIVRWAVIEAKKQGPYFFAPGTTKNARHSQLFYERLTGTGFEGCNSEF